MIASQSRIVAAPDQIFSNLGDEAVLLSLTDGVYYGLDPVGTRVWDLVQEPRTITEVRDAIVAALTDGTIPDRPYRRLPR